MNAKKFLTKIVFRLKFFFFTPRFSIADSPVKLLRLGSEYGGWTFAQIQVDSDFAVISAGAGEDVSFDIELINLTGLKVFAVDPTQRAINHFQEIHKSSGNPQSKPYNLDGKQDTDSYNLAKINSSNFVLVPQALWVHNNEVKFFSPRDNTHVSHSISNIQNNFSLDSEHIFVKAITLETLMREYLINDIFLLKLDIEGAEIEVIERMLAYSIFPIQILIEYDEILFPSLKSKKRVTKCHGLLEENGYRLIHIEWPSNFLYLHNSYKRYIRKLD